MASGPLFVPPSSPQTSCREERRREGALGCFDLGREVELWVDPVEKQSSPRHRLLLPGPAPPPAVSNTQLPRSPDEDVLHPSTEAAVQPQASHSEDLGQGHRL